jgi:hypothetical protein
MRNIELQSGQVLDVSVGKPDKELAWIVILLEHKTTNKSNKLSVNGTSAVGHFSKYPAVENLP